MQFTYQGCSSWGVLGFTQPFIYSYAPGLCLCTRILCTVHRLTHLCQHADPFWCLHFAGCWLFTNHLWLFIYLYKRVCFCFLNSYSKQKANTSIFNIMYIQHVLDNQHTTFKKLGLSNWGLFPIVPVFFAQLSTFSKWTMAGLNATLHISYSSSCVNSTCRELWTVDEP